MPNSTRSTKPSKPRPDFPLYCHATGRWAKKIRGKLHYFGKIADDPKGEKALTLWNDQKDDLLDGRAPRSRAGAVAVRDLVNQYLNHKRRLKEAGDICQWTFDEYNETCGRLVRVFGASTAVDSLRPDDFGRLRATIAAGVKKKWGPVRVANEIQRVRGIFRYGYESELLDKIPRFGPDFKKPSMKSQRIARAKRGKRLFEAEQIRTLLASCPPDIKAMVLLGVQAGMGNNDVATLPIDAVDLARGWIVFPRPKTGVERKIPIWKETVEAIAAWLKVRPKPVDPENDGLLFVSSEGRSLRGDQMNHPVSDRMARTLKRLKMKRDGLSFYGLRHTFQTIGEGSRDMPAVKSIMGHATAGNDMSATYREGIDDDRLKAVVDCVHDWLWPATVATATAAEAKGGDGDGK